MDSFIDMSDLESDDISEAFTRGDIGEELADIEETGIEYLCEPFIPRRIPILINGSAGVGKTWLLCYLAAVVSSGQAWFNGQENIDGPSGVVLITEDNIGQTIKPRLRMLGAKDEHMRNIASLQKVPPKQATLGAAMQTPFTLPTNLLELDQMIVKKGATLVIIDPVTSVLEQMNNQTLYQKVMVPLSELAARRGCTIILCNHIGKGRYNPKNVNTAIGGPIALQQGVRASYLIQEDSERPNLNVVSVHKWNIGPQPSPFGYERVQTGRGTNLRFTLQDMPHTTETKEEQELNTRRKITTYLKKRGPAQPHVLAQRLDIPDGTVRVNLYRMCEAGLVERLTDGKYTITEQEMLVQSPTTII